MDSVHAIISRSLSKYNQGNIFFASDFRGSGTQAAIKMALSRLSKTGRLRRLSHGIYFVPFIDPVLGEITPSPEGVAEQLAEREKVRIRPTGVFALNKLGLSTQVPTRLVYLTDGHPRKFKVGKASVEFKATTPKKMALSGQLSGPLILGLEELNLEKIDKQSESRILEILQAEHRGVLDQDLRLAPNRIYDYLIKLVKKLDENSLVASIK